MYSCLLFYSGFYKEIVCKEKWKLDDVSRNCMVSMQEGEKDVRKNTNSRVR